MVHLTGRVEESVIQEATRLKLIPPKATGKGCCFIGLWIALIRHGVIHLGNHQSLTVGTETEEVINCIFLASTLHLKKTLHCMYIEMI